MNPIIKTYHYCRIRIHIKSITHIYTKLTFILFFFFFHCVHLLIWKSPSNMSLVESTKLKEECAQLRNKEANMMKDSALLKVYSTIPFPF
jgi:hypothetical protein